MRYKYISVTFWLQSVQPFTSDSTGHEPIWTSHVKRSTLCNDSAHNRPTSSGCFLATCVVVSSCNTYNNYDHLY